MATKTSTPPSSSLISMAKLQTPIQQQEEGAQKTHILIIPYPAQGHMLALLDLAYHLSSRFDHLSISIVVTPKNLSLLSPLLSSSPSIRPVIFSFPMYSSLPPGVENTKDLPPSLSSFLLVMHALSFLHTPILDWVDSITNPPVCIISDFFLGWTYRLAQDLDIPRFTFCPSGALTLAITNYLWINMPKGPGEVKFESLPGSPVYNFTQLSTVYRSYREGDPLSEFIKDGFLGNIKSYGVVFNTSEDLEGKYLESVRRDLGHDRVWAVGPLSLLGGGSASDRGGPSSVPAGELLTWLDGKEEGSVIYVCFGSQAELLPEQAAAVAAGLEESGAHFIWCMRAAGPVPGSLDGSSVQPSSVPTASSVGAECVGTARVRTEGKGLVIRGWGPQVEILNHRAVGFFFTHCGWNSVLEGIAGGVVMLTWPMGADQYYNARLLEEELGVGVRVCEGRDTAPDGEELGRVMRELVGGGEEKRRRATELREKALKAVVNEGSSWREIDDLVQKITEFKKKVII